MQKNKPYTQRAWLRLLIKDHPPPPPPPPFCLSFRLLTSLKAAWTRGEPRGPLPGLLLVSWDFGASGADEERRYFALFTPWSCVSWSLCGNHLLSSQQRGKMSHSLLMDKSTDRLWQHQPKAEKGGSRGARTCDKPTSSWKVWKYFIQASRSSAPIVSMWNGVVFAHSVVSPSPWFTTLSQPAWKSAAPCLAVELLRVYYFHVICVLLI